MSYNKRIDNIRKQYDITDTDLEKIKIELKRKLKENHPDNNSDYDADFFIELKEDLDYVEGLLSTSEMPLMPVSEVIRALAEALQVPSEQGNTQKDKLETELSANVDNQILTIKKRHRIPKFSSASLLAVITLLWMFPNQVIEHPLMPIIFYNIEVEEYVVAITWLWFFVLAFTCFFWIKAIYDEKILCC